MPKKRLFYREDFEKKYKRLRIAFLVFILLFAGFIYMNFDYLAFKFLISYNYSYTDALDEIYVEAISRENVKGYFRNFDDVTIAVFTEKLREIAGDKYTYLYTPKQYELKKDYDKLVVAESVIKELDTDTIYLYIPNITKYTKDFIFDNKDILVSYKNIVIDLRSNPGGGLEAMYKIADLFLEKGQTIGYEQTRHSLTSSHIKASGSKELVYDHIVILQDANTASACEGFTNALRENLDPVTVMGETSFGKGIGQFTMPLKSGFAVKATVMEVETPERNSINKVGIVPDVEYTGEDIVEHALSFINEQPPKAE